jgi:hypothetical protein
MITSLGYDILIGQVEKRYYTRISTTERTARQLGLNMYDYGARNYDPNW